MRVSIVSELSHHLLSWQDSNSHIIIWAGNDAGVSRIPLGVPDIFFDFSAGRSREPGTQKDCC